MSNERGVGRAGVDNTSAADTQVRARGRSSRHAAVLCCSLLGAGEIPSPFGSSFRMLLVDTYTAVRLHRDSDPLRNYVVSLPGESTTSHHLHSSVGRCAHGLLLVVQKQSQKKINGDRGIAASVIEAAQ